MTARAHAGPGLFDAPVNDVEQVDDPGYARRRAHVVARLATRSDRQASIDQVPAEFRSLVMHLLHLILAEELANVTSRDVAAALIDEIPLELVELCKARARSTIQARRSRVGATAG